jgi:rhodanese-related sulfurtransferase
MRKVISLSVEELSAWLGDAGRPAPLLLDVREAWEFEFCALADAQLLPLSLVPSGSSTLDRSRELVCVCHHGIRSMHAAVFLAQQGFEKVYNLTGGVDAWAQRVDSTMPRY